MKIKEINTKIMQDSRHEDTIEVSIKSEAGVFSSSAPSGKSKGRNEAPAYMKNINEDIKTLTNLDRISDVEIDKFSDLTEIEKIVKGRVGANSLFVLEASILKALAFEKGKALWQIINEKAKRFPHPIGNCVGGGLHTRAVNGLKPDFQEFLVIPRTRKFVDDVFLARRIHEDIGKILRKRKCRGELNDEKAWSAGLTNDEVLEILDEERKNLELEIDNKIEIGIDVAASSFYSSGYIYKNPWRKLAKDEQIDYISEIAKKFDIFYIEDPLQQEDFEGFAELRERTFGNSLIVADDLVASRIERFVKAFRNRSINALIVKPNQCGSLIEIKKLIEIAKKLGVVTIMSHRSGETIDYALADLAFGFQTEFVKFGILGKEREIKLNRLIEIERKFG